MFRLLQSIYPNIDASQLKKKPKGYWNSADNQRQFVQRLENELSILFIRMNVYPLEIKNVEDWDSVSVKSVQIRGGGGWLTMYHNSFRNGHSHCD
jgi:hypothetical protein